MAETFLYLTTTGRATGTPHKIEIWFVAHDDCYYLCSGGKYDADWVKNVQQQPQVTYYLAEGMDVVPDYEINGHAEVIDDDGDLERAVKALFEAKYNWSNGLLVQVCPVDRPL
ncbi:MAG: nitroreductase/quinone reductase family protein [Chloroflexota bacterium]